MRKSVKKVESLESALKDNVSVSESLCLSQLGKAAQTLLPSWTTALSRQTSGSPGSKFLQTKNKYRKKTRRWIWTFIYNLSHLCTLRLCGCECKWDLDRTWVLLSSWHGDFWRSGTWPWTRPAPACHPVLHYQSRSHQCWELPRTACQAEVFTLLVVPVLAQNYENDNVTGGQMLKIESPSAVHAGCAGGESYWQQGPGVPGRGASGSCSRGLERTRPSIELPPFFSCCLTLRKISKWWIGGSFWPAVSPAQAGWFGFSQKRSSRMGLLPGTRRG